VEYLFAPPNLNHAVIHYASPTQWLTDQLAVAVCTLGYFPEQTWIQLPALVLDSNRFGTVATPLPLKLASERSPAGTKASVEAIGHALMDCLNRLPTHLWIAPRYWMHPEGWLYAEFSPESLAQWFQAALTLKPRLEVQETSTPTSPRAIATGISADPQLFELQYAHARCCSLLNLGQQAQLIQLADDNSFRLKSPNPIPWQTAQGELRLQTESERKLLLAFIQFAQSLGGSGEIYGCAQSRTPGCQTPVRWPLGDRTRNDQIWSRHFEDFYREGRILGSVQAQTPELAQARLASLVLLKNLLEFWLVAVLQIDAPTEL
jgi:hypothetical protein